MAWFKKYFQRAIESYRFYKGSDAVLKIPNESDFRLLPPNEDNVKTIDALENLHNVIDAPNSKLKFSDFCK